MFRTTHRIAKLENTLYKITFCENPDIGTLMDPTYIEVIVKNLKTHKEILFDVWAEKYYNEKLSYDENFLMNVEIYIKENFSNKIKVLDKIKRREAEEMEEYAA